TRCIHTSSPRRILPLAHAGRRSTHLSSKIIRGPGRDTEAMRCAGASCGDVRQEAFDQVRLLYGASTFRLIKPTLFLPRQNDMHRALAGDVIAALIAESRHIEVCEEILSRAN